jgi:hypothetical protein
MLDKLPSELLLNVFDHLSFAEILKVKDVNKSLHDKCQGVAGYIVTRECKAKYNMNMDKMCIAIEKMLSYNYNIGQGVFAVNESIVNNFTAPPISRNLALQQMYLEVSLYYLQNWNLKNYQNKFQLYILYNLLLIDVYKTDIGYQPILEFATDITKNSNMISASLAYSLSNYYTHLLSIHAVLKFAHLKEMSKLVVTLPMLLKLWGIYKLDLSRTKFHHCCGVCIDFENIPDIVTYKYNMKDDCFLSENYSTVKNFLWMHCPDVFDYICKHENVIVNREITYVHPFANTRVSLSSRTSQQLLFTMQFEEDDSPYIQNILKNLKRYIRVRQSYLKQMYFS